MSGFKNGEETELDPFYAEFKEDCNGNGVDLQDFLRERFVDAMTAKDAFWVVQFPHTDVDPKNRQEWEKQGLGRGTVKEFSPDDVKDFELDETGRLLWIRFHKCEDIALAPNVLRGTVTETFWEYTADDFTVYQIVYKNDQYGKPQPTTEIPIVFTAPHKLGVVPVVMMSLDDGLWLADTLSGPQVANWQARTKRAWLSNNQAYSIPVIASKDTTAAANISGAGYAIQLGQGDTFTWTSPPDSAATILEAEIKNSKDELYRIANLNFMGLENNSMALVRSGLSRTIDADAGHVTVQSMAYTIRDAAQRTYAMLARGRGDDVDSFVAGGFEHLSDYDLTELTAIAVQLGIPKIPSPKFNKQFWKRMVAQALDMDEATRNAINKEIDDSPDELPPDSIAQTDSTVDPNSIPGPPENNKPAA